MDLEKVFFSIADALPYSMMVTDGNADDPRIVYANDTVEKMTGYSYEELRGKNPKFLQGEMTDRSVLDKLKKCLQERTDFSGCTYNYRKNGEPFFLKWCIKSFSVGKDDFFVAIQQELTTENSYDFLALDCEFASKLLRNLTAYYRNTLVIYNYLHEILEEENFDLMARSDVINALQVRDGVTLAASNLTEYLLTAGTSGKAGLSF